MSQIYDAIGRSYAGTRRTDPRIAAQIRAGIGDVETLLNVGAGAGSYEPEDLGVVALEPSATMIRQRAPGAPPAVQAAAEYVPFVDDSFDAVLASLTIHHWPDIDRGLAELRRVARRRIVIFTWDQEVWEQFWLLREYTPPSDVDRQRYVPIERLREQLPVESVDPVPVPHDCTDGFHGAFWRRPEAYLDPQVLAGISTYASMEPSEYEDAFARLAADLESGAWHERHADLLERDALDLGYRLVVARAD